MLLNRIDLKHLARRVTLALATVGFVILLRPTANAGESVKLELSPKSLPQVLALIRPQENEWRHLQVEWLTDVVAARKRAAAEDKPIVICYTGGAGYNEPLGVC
jgi:hypothetical protein